MSKAVKGMRVEVNRGVAECPKCTVEIGKPMGSDVYMCAGDCSRWVPVREAILLDEPIVHNCTGRKSFEL